MLLPTMQAGLRGASDQAGEPGRTQSGSAQWLAFAASHRRYLFALEHVGEVLQARDITKIPFTQPWFCGAVNVRGVLHGVIDLEAFLSLGGNAQDGIPHRSRVHANANSDHMVTFNAALNWPCALAAGSLQGLRSPADFPGATDDGSAESPLLIGIRRDTLNARWLEVDLPAVVASARARGITAE